MTALCEGVRVVAMTAPGRFPTVVHDPGAWWPALAGEGTPLVRWSASAVWWRILTEPGTVRAALADATLPGLAASAAAAAASLDDLQTRACLASRTRYLAAVGAVARHLRLLNAGQDALEFTLAGGLEVAGVAYHDSATLVAAAGAGGPLRVLSEGVAAHYPARPGNDGIDLLAVRVTTPEDLLLAMAVVLALRRRGVRLHACLADHGHENFTLRPHLERLRASGALLAVFDTVIEARDERDALVPAIVRAVQAGEEPRGFLRAADPALRTFVAPVPSGTAPGTATGPVYPPPIPVFAPEPVLVTRLSGRRCYWARCAFCVHNAKYDDRRVPSTGDVPAAADGLEAALAAGYRIVTLNDEALSPAILTALCEELERRRVPDRYPDFRWTGRAKLELAFDAALFRRLRRTGCVQMLFGLESGSERVRHLMDKHTPGLDRSAVLAIVRAAREAAVAVHLNVIAGFPGETVEELEATFDLVAEALEGMPDATWLVNRFVVFPATPVAADPERFGIEVAQPDGDMPAMLPFRPAAGWAAEASAIALALPLLAATLDARLGWDELEGDPDGRTARWLLFGTGHGTVARALGLPLVVVRPPAVAVA